MFDVPSHLFPDLLQALAQNPASKDLPQIYTEVTVQFSLHRRMTKAVRDYDYLKLYIQGRLKIFPEDLYPVYQYMLESYTEAYVGLAISEQRPDIAQDLIARGFGIPDNAIMLAIEKGHHDFALVLVGRGANTDGIVELALRKRQYSLIQTLVERGVHLTASNILNMVFQSKLTVKVLEHRRYMQTVIRAQPNIFAKVDEYLDWLMENYETYDYQRLRETMKVYGDCLDNWMRNKNEPAARSDIRDIKWALESATSRIGYLHQQLPEGLSLREMLAMEERDVPQMVTKFQCRVRMWKKARRSMLLSEWARVWWAVSHQKVGELEEPLAQGVAKLPARAFRQVMAFV